MNLVAVLISTTLMGIGALIADHYFSTPLCGTAGLSGEAVASVFAESLK